MSHCCEHNSKEGEKIIIGKRLKIFGTIFVLFFALSFLPYFAPLNESLLSYVKIIWWAVLIGFLIGGFIDYFIPDEFIFKFLGGRKKRNLF